MARNGQETVKFYDSGQALTKVRQLGGQVFKSRGRPMGLKSQLSMNNAHRPFARRPFIKIFHFLVRFGLVSKFADTLWWPFWSRKGAVMSPQRRPGRNHWQRPENDRKTTGCTKLLRLGALTEKM
jgi:hypothetical protein